MAPTRLLRNRSLGMENVIMTMAWAFTVPTAYRWQKSGELLSIKMDMPTAMNWIAMGYRFLILTGQRSASCIGWQSCWKTGSLMFPLAWRWKPRIIFARIFLWTTRAAMLSSAIAQMTVTFPLRRTLSMGPFPIASLTTLCT